MTNRCKPLASPRNRTFLSSLPPRRGVGDSIAILQEQITMISVALEKLE